MTSTTRTSSSGGQPDGVLRILVVEDEPHVRRLISRRLQQAGFCVWTAATGEEAIALVESEREPVQLVITDGIMPGMDGFDLARYFLQRSPAVPVILISGFVVHFMNRTDIPGNIDRFFDKPFSGEELVAHILDRFGATA